MKKITFRFFFVYFLVSINPISWFYQVPGISHLYQYYGNAEQWIVEIFNKYIFHIKDTLNLNGGGSGDTSFGWGQFYTYFVLAIIGCIIWTLLSKNKENYNSLDFWLRITVRYYIAYVSLAYGIIKIFALQMPFANLSQLATPLGDFLPMRLSWMFIGYSTPYQAFSGVMEIMVGVLLLNRKTVTLGSLAGIAVFLNVFVLNLSYDIPVKIFSMHILISCIFLASGEWNRLSNFFLFNRVAEPFSDYTVTYSKRWQKIVRIVWKVTFIITLAIIPLHNSWNRYQAELSKSDLKPIKSGIYNIKSFVKNKDTVTVSMQDELAWKDFIFDKGGNGSINTLDTVFRQRYRRGYFTYQPDSVKEIISFKKFATDTINIFEMQYKILNEKTLRLWGKIRNDSVYIELVRTDRHFQLTERQFHWISESNR